MFNQLTSERTHLNSALTDTDIMHFESNCSQPYTEQKLKILKDHIGIIEKESGQSFSRMMWRD